MGDTKASPQEVCSRLAELEQEWLGNSYDLLERNCVHFAEALCCDLGVDRVPPEFGRAARKASNALATLNDIVVVAEEQRQALSVNLTTQLQVAHRGLQDYATSAALWSMAFGLPEACGPECRDTCFWRSK